MSVNVNCLSSKMTQGVNGERDPCILANTLSQDIIQHLFAQCIFQCDFLCIGTLSCASTYYHQALNQCWKHFNLKQCCPQGLTILDLKTMGFTGLEPKINHFEVVKNFHEMARHVEDNKGCTLLTMPKGSLTQQLLQSTQYASISQHSYWVEHRIQTHGNMSVDQPYVIIIANNIFNGTRNKGLNERALLVAELGCEMPTVQELVVQGVFTNRIFNELLYVNHPWTYAYPSLQAKGVCFVVGGSSFQAVNDAFCPHFRKDLFGVSGRRVLKAVINS